jgi:putative transposase
MSIRTEHKDHLCWFITFTCYDWLPLFNVTDSYDLVYNWFNHLKENQLNR